MRPRSSSGASCALLRAHGQSDTDPISGFLEARAFTRHVARCRPGGHPRPTRPPSWRWTSTASAAGTPRTATAPATPCSRAWPRASRRSALAGGIWSRLGADRFAWIGIGHDARRRPAIWRRSSAASRPTTRASWAPAPPSSSSPTTPPPRSTRWRPWRRGSPPPRPGERRVVAFDRGRLDGVEYSAGYTASLAQRRAAILEMLTEPGTIATVFQPIVSLDNGRTVGFEVALALPRRARAPAGQVDRRGPRRRPGSRDRGGVRPPRLSPCATACPTPPTSRST